MCNQQHLCFQATVYMCTSGELTWGKKESMLLSTTGHRSVMCNQQHLCFKATVYRWGKKESQWPYQQLWLAMDRNLSCVIHQQCSWLLSHFVDLQQTCVLTTVSIMWPATTHLLTNDSRSLANLIFDFVTCCQFSDPLMWLLLLCKFGVWCVVWAYVCYILCRQQTNFPVWF